MRRERHPKEWLREFESFLRHEETPPWSTSETILARVRADLQPQPAPVVVKILALHAVSALVMTIFCPQLGVGPLVGGHGIMHVFMRYGDVACAALCGSIFLGTSALLSSIFLRKAELRVAGRHALVATTALSTVTVAALMLAGGGADRAALLAWIGGAIVGGWLVLRAGTWARMGRHAAPLRAGR